jgi:hypothetical protein
MRRAVSFRSVLCAPAGPSSNRASCICEFPTLTSWHRRRLACRRAHSFHGSCLSCQCNINDAMRCGGRDLCVTALCGVALKGCVGAHAAMMRVTRAQLARCHPPIRALAHLSSTHSLTLMCACARVHPMHATGRWRLVADGDQRIRSDRCAVGLRASRLDSVRADGDVQRFSRHVRSERKQAVRCLTHSFTYIMRFERHFRTSSAQLTPLYMLPQGPPSTTHTFAFSRACVHVLSDVAS